MKISPRFLRNKGSQIIPRTIDRTSGPPLVPENANRQTDDDYHRPPAKQNANERDIATPANVSVRVCSSPPHSLTVRADGRMGLEGARTERALNGHIVIHDSSFLYARHQKFTEYFIDQEGFFLRVRSMTEPDTTILNAFAKVLRDRRREAGLSQEELAHRAGLSMRYVSLLESRRHQPSLATLYALADSLGISLTALVQDIESQAKS